MLTDVLTYQGSTVALSRLNFDRAVNNIVTNLYYRTTHLEIIGLKIYDFYKINFKLIN